MVETKTILNKAKTKKVFFRTLDILKQIIVIYYIHSPKDKICSIQILSLISQCSSFFTWWRLFNAQSLWIKHHTIIACSEKMPKITQVNPCLQFGDFSFIIVRLLINIDAPGERIRMNALIPDLKSEKLHKPRHINQYFGNVISIFQYCACQHFVASSTWIWSHSLTKRLRFGYWFLRRQYIHMFANDNEWY